MTSTDPTKFDPETTGVFKAVPLAEAMRPGYAGDDGAAPPPCGWDQVNNAPPCGWSADCEVHGQNAPIVLPYTYPPVQQAPVSLMYAHSDGQTFTRVDVENGLTHPSVHDGDDNVHRERLLLRAVLEHTLAMLKGEDVS